MTDFPRGWASAGDSAGGTGSLTVPAVTGIAHVLDSFDAKLTAVSNAAQLVVELTLTSSDGIFSGFVLARLAVGVPTSPQVEIDTASASSLDLAAGPGASLTIAFASGVVGVFQTLLIQGHDI